MPLTKQSAKHAHLLLLVDESSASERMVAYVADMIARRRNFHLHLLYLMPRMPARLLETGGAEDPEQEILVDEELHREQDRWISSEKSAAKPKINGLVARMRHAGVANAAIDIAFSDPFEGPNADRAILSFATDKQCHTIVVGHDSHSWLREITGGHLAEQLLRHAKGMAIWVVQ